MRLALTLIGLSHLATIVALVAAVPRHVVDPSWPAHAQNHTLQGLFWIVGFNLLCLLILAIPFRRLEQWAWWVLLLAGTFIYGGFLLAVPITQGGAPGITDDVFFAGLWGLQIAGLLIGRRSFSFQRTA